MVKSGYEAALPYVAVDKTLIRELLHPQIHGDMELSLAEIVVAPYEKIQTQKNSRSDRIFHVIEGKGSMRIGDRVFTVNARDSFSVPRDIIFEMENSGECFLRVLCFCSPALNNNDTELY